MGLPTTYSQEFKKFKDFFGKIRDAQAPPKFTNQLLMDWGFKSNNHRPFIPLLKSLGFLTSDGVPTQRYLDYRNHAISKQILGEAIKESYSDIFLIKEKPTSADRGLIEGKFKSYHNTSDTVAGLMTKTFYALLDLADINNGTSDSVKPNKNGEAIDNSEEEDVKSKAQFNRAKGSFGLHYNIQIHLPATKDVEVYNAIFKSLKAHLLE
ncbi:MAG: hypothetical protein EOO43_26485 [Flavobacterium sp.]|nr:MAG: hypothetical protein EOO43_26485 [Flavobacterium sp.]